MASSQPSAATSLLLWLQSVCHDPSQAFPCLQGLTLMLHWEEGGRWPLCFLTPGCTPCLVVAPQGEDALGVPLLQLLWKVSPHFPDVRLLSAAHIQELTDILVDQLDAFRDPLQYALQADSGPTVYRHCTT